MECHRESLSWGVFSAGPECLVFKSHGSNLAAGVKVISVGGVSDLRCGCRFLANVTISI